MDPVGLTVLIVTLVAATALGAWRLRTDGRVRPVRRPGRGHPPVPQEGPATAPVHGRDATPGHGGDAAPGHGADPTPGQPSPPALALGAAADRGLLDVVGSRGERATLVQFSSAFCAPCRATRVLLADVAQRTDGVRHVEVDAEAHLDLVRRLGITRTPTTLVLDAAGNEIGRAGGVPRRDQLAAVLGALGARQASH